MQVSTGERRKPHPDGRPGFLRVDSVHQGDKGGEKGLYEINLVDEVTQYAFVAAVDRPSSVQASPGSGRDQIDDFTSRINFAVGEPNWANQATPSATMSTSTT